MGKELKGHVWKISKMNTENARQINDNNEPDNLPKV